jgi:molybdate transport system substrate-binding protein
VKRLLATSILASALAGSAQAEEVTVFAAASLTDAVQEIARAYEASSGNKVVFNLGASNDLARQIRAGAAADVFFSADSAQMDALERAGLVRAQDRVEALSNVLVVVVPADSTASLHSAADLASLRRIALADPEAVPAGVYARTYLQSAGLWEKLKERVIPTLSVRAALAAVESGNVEAGIVYRTDASASRRVRVAFAVDREQGPRIVYVLAPLAPSRKPTARDLVRYLLCAGARRIYERHGFLVIAGR